MRVFVGIIVAILIALNVWQFMDRLRLRDNANQTQSNTTVRVEAVAAPLREQASALTAEKRALTKKVAQLEAAAEQSASRSNEGPVKGMVAAMENPAMKETLAAQQRATLNAQYQRLYENLSLEGVELEHFQKLLTDAQMVIMENGMQLMSPDITPEERQELAETIGASQDDLKEQVQTFLNDDADFDYYNFYTDTLGERMAMNGLRSTLPGEPLDTASEEALVKLMYDERQAINFEEHYYDQNRFDPSAMTQAKMDRFMVQYDQLQNNLATRASRVLNETQLEAFNSNQKTSRAMQEMGMSMMFNMFGQKSP